MSQSNTILLSVWQGQGHLIKEPSVTVGIKRWNQLVVLIRGVK